MPEYCIVENFGREIYEILTHQYVKIKYLDLPFCALNFKILHPFV